MSTTTLGTSTQAITSKNTSINSTKLPAIYNKINWDELMDDWKIQNEDKENSIGIILDYGCGRYTDHIQDFVNSKGFYYLGYDPYWNPIDFQSEIEQISKIKGGGIAAIICSNVLNVIPWWEGVKKTSHAIHALGHRADNRYFISIYSGDNSNRGRETKKDCWQWNRPTKAYLFDPCDIVKKDVIVNKECAYLLK